MGLPWWSSGWDSVFPLEGAQVPPLIWELGSCMPCSQNKTNKKQNKRKSRGRQSPRGLRLLYLGQVSTLIKVPTIQTHLSGRYHGKCPR